MKKVFRFDFYKFTKMTATWGIMLCVIVFSIMSLAITYFSKAESEIPEVVLEVGEQMVDIPMEEMTVVDWCMDSIGGDFLMLFVVVFAVLFTCSDYMTGVLKNIYNSINKKWHYVLSKMLIVSFSTILMVAVTYLLAMIFSLLVVKTASFGDIVELLEFTVYKILLLIAYGNAGVLASFVLKKTSTALILCMGYSFMFSNLIYSGINQVVKSIGISEDFEIQKYTLVGNSISFNANVSTEQETIVLVVCSITLFISLVVSTVLFYKRDI